VYHPQVLIFQVFFIATEPLGSSAAHLPTSGPSIWVQLEQDNFFNEYKLEGVTPEQVSFSTFQRAVYNANSDYCVAPCRATICERRQTHI
jgi:hypothetical protein